MWERWSKVAWRTGSIDAGDGLEAIVSSIGEVIASASNEKSLNTVFCNLAPLITGCEALVSEAPETVSRKSQKFACVKSERI